MNLTESRQADTLHEDALALLAKARQLMQHYKQTAPMDASDETRDLLLAVKEASATILTLFKQCDKLEEASQTRMRLDAIKGNLAAVEEKGQTLFERFTLDLQLDRLRTKRMREGFAVAKPEAGLDAADAINRIQPGQAFFEHIDNSILDSGAELPQNNRANSNFDFFDKQIDALTANMPKQDAQAQQRHLEALYETDLAKYRELNLKVKKALSQQNNDADDENSARLSTP